MEPSYTRFNQKQSIIYNAFQTKNKKTKCALGPYGDGGEKGEYHNNTIHRETRTQNDAQCLKQASSRHTQQKTAQPKRGAQRHRHKKRQRSAQATSPARCLNMPICAGKKKIRRQSTLYIYCFARRGDTKDEEGRQEQRHEVSFLFFRIYIHFWRKDRMTNEQQRKARHIEREREREREREPIKHIKRNSAKCLEPANFYTKNTYTTYVSVGFFVSGKSSAEAEKTSPCIGNINLNA